MAQRTFGGGILLSRKYRVSTGGRYAPGDKPCHVRNLHIALSSARQVINQPGGFYRVFPPPPKKDPIRKGHAFSIMEASG